MSECSEAPKRNRRESPPPEVKFAIRNPEAIIRPEVARALLELLRAPCRQRITGHTERLSSNR
jgi:hypothetical protein